MRRQKEARVMEGTRIIRAASAFDPVQRLQVTVTTDERIFGCLS